MYESYEKTNSIRSSPAVVSGDISKDIPSSNALYTTRCAPHEVSGHVINALFARQTIYLAEIPISRAFRSFVFRFETALRARGFQNTRRTFAIVRRGFRPFVVGVLSASTVGARTASVRFVPPLEVRSRIVEKHTRFRLPRRYRSNDISVRRTRYSIMIKYTDNAYTRRRRSR